MNSKENKRSVFVGIFVLIGIIILIVGILMLGNQQSHFSSTITVSTQVKNVEGLQAGSNVWFSGVKVGTVKNIKFEGLESVRVELLIEEKSREFIRKDAKAKLGSDGLIGNKIIIIEGGSGSAPKVEEGDVLVAADVTGTDELLSTLQVNNTNLVGITENLKELTDKLLNGQGPVGALLTDTTMSIQIVQILKNLNATTQYTTQATNELTQFTKTLNNPDGLMSNLLTDTSIYQNLNASVAQLHNITVSAQEVIGNLNSVTQDLNRSDNVLQVLLRDENSAEDVKKILHNLEQSSQKLDENLEALQHNFLFRGFFRKKAKEEAEQN